MRSLRPRLGPGELVSLADATLDHLRGFNGSQKTERASSTLVLPELLPPTRRFIWPSFSNFASRIPRKRWMVNSSICLMNWLFLLIYKKPIPWAMFVLTYAWYNIHNSMY